MSDKVSYESQIEQGLIRVNDRHGSHYVAGAPTTNAYAITPAQAQQLDRMTQPIYIPDAPPSQTSTTSIDVSAIFAPIPIKEQHTPTERAHGFMLKSVLFILAALLVSLAGAWLVDLSSIEWFGFFAGLFLITLLILNWQETTYSSAGLAIRHERNARSALDVIVASNERVTVAKLVNEDAAHEREVGLRSQLADRLISRIGGDK